MDDLMGNSVLTDPGLHRKLWGGARRRILMLPGHWFNYPPSFLFHYLERFVRSLVYLPFLLFYPFRIITTSARSHEQLERVERDDSPTGEGAST